MSISALEHDEILGGDNLEIIDILKNKLKGFWFICYSNSSPVLLMFHIDSNLSSFQLRCSELNPIG